jgi:hypothetical protein
MTTIALCASGPARATNDGVLARVPIQFERTQVRVPVSVNGSAPFILILDTGMPTRGVLLRHSERVNALGLDYPDSDEITGGGSGEAVAVRIATARQVTVGGMSIPDARIIVLPPGAGLPLDVDGVIGAELFERYAVRVDVDREELTLIDNAVFVPGAKSTVVPMRLRDGKAFIDARVTVANGEPVDADLAVDLGAGHSLWLNQGENGRLAPPAQTVERTLGRGLVGNITGSMARVRRLEIGDIAFENVVTLFPVEEHQHPGGVDFHDGFVGAGILTRFVVTYDYAAKRMVFERGGHFADPFEADMTGMILDLRGIERRRVDGVLANSPADQAGVEVGDVLVAIDGKSLVELGPDGVAHAFERDGADVRVTIERGGTTIEKRFRLRRLI